MAGNISQQVKGQEEALGLRLIIGASGRMMLGALTTEGHFRSGIDFQDHFVKAICPCQLLGKLTKTHTQHTAPQSPLMQFLL